MNDGKVVIGKVLKHHGIKGEIKVLPITKDINRFELLKKIYINQKSYKVKNVKFLNKFVALKLENINSIEDVETIKNFYIEISEEDVIKCEEGEYFYYQLEGLNVYTLDGKYLGDIDEIMELPANDIYVVKSNDKKEILIPAVNDVIKEIDIKNNKMIVELLDGLI